LSALIKNCIITNFEEENIALFFKIFNWFYKTEGGLKWSYCTKNDIEMQVKAGGVHCLYYRGGRNDTLGVKE
jgi:hypothetical protein